MEMIGLAILVLTLACAACGTHTTEQNQYETNREGSFPIQLHDKVVHKSISIQIPHRFNVSFNKAYGKDLIRTRKKRSTNENGRDRRSYNPWSNYILRPPNYQISRPYLIPVWGPPGRIPIYFPPQPIPYNPGFPPVNPINGLEPPRMDYLPPNKGYLPPDPSQTTPKPETTTDMFIDKFDENPIWGDGESQTIPPAVGGRPTRRPRPNLQTSTHPPLVHSVNNKSGGPNNLSPFVPSEPATRRPTDNFFPRPTPPPETNFIPQQPEIPFTSRPPVQSTRSPAKKPLSNCVWAIVQCCSATTTAYSERCFEERNCAPAFWDASPCESEFARAAIASANQYYLGR